MRKLILATAVLCAGCGGSEPLTEAEAVGILTALMQLFNEADGVNEGDTESVSCPSGGFTIVEFVSEVETLEGDTLSRYETRWSIRPAACAMTSAGTPFTVDGDPDVRLRSEVLQLLPGDDEDYDLQIWFDGGFTWDRDSEGGASCEMSLEAQDVVVNDIDFSLDGTVTGSLCGLDVTFDLRRVTGE